MSKHFKTPNKDLRKRGFQVSIFQHRYPQTEEQFDENARNVESGMKALKKRMLQEGFAKEIRRKDFHVTKGQKNRRKKQEAVLRERTRRIEDAREWNPDSLIGMHSNKRKRRKSS